MKLLPIATSLLISTQALPDYNKPDVPLYEGSCPAVSGTSAFNIDEYIKTPWWNIAASPFFWFSETSSCQTATYQKSENYAGYITVFNSGLYNNASNPNAYDYNDFFRYTSVGLAIQDPGKEGTNSVQFPYPAIPDTEEDNYVVLATDNKSYSFVWACRPFHPRKPLANTYRAILWILSKDRNMSSQLKQQQIDYAMDLLKYKFQWGEADNFAATVAPLQTFDCPDIPSFNEQDYA